MTLYGMLKRHPPDLILYFINPATGIYFESLLSTELSLTGGAQITQMAPDKVSGQGLKVRKEFHSSKNIVLLWS